MHATRPETIAYRGHKFTNTFVALPERSGEPRELAAGPRSTVALAQARGKTPIPIASVNVMSSPRGAGKASLHQGELDGLRAVHGGLR
jgi:hypothetical protein